MCNITQNDRGHEFQQLFSSGETDDLSFFRSAHSECEHDSSERVFGFIYIDVCDGILT